METILIDSTFLIDLQRGVHNEKRKGAESWLVKNRTTSLKIPCIVLAEFAAGFETTDDPLLSEIYHRHEIVPIGVPESLCYAKHYRELKENGNLIGGNDLWIAAIALCADLPILTRNVDHFSRVSSLVVETY